jgi:hypothetical protein
MLNVSVLSSFPCLIMGAVLLDRGLDDIRPYRAMLGTLILMVAILNIVINGNL